MNYQHQSKRGIASIIGGVFIVLIILSGYAFYILNNRTTNELQGTLRTMSTLDIDRRQEEVKFNTVVPDGNSLKINIGNVGSKLINIKYVGWIKVPEQNDPYYDYEFLKVDRDIQPAGTIDYPVDVGFEKGGKYLVKMISSTGNIFTVGYPLIGGQSSASIALDPLEGNVGDIIKVSGSNFDPGSQITIEFDGVVQPIVQPSSSETSSLGAFQVSIIVPPKLGGAHSVKAITSTTFATATFIVSSTIALTPAYGPVGRTVAITGSGFAPASGLSATFNGGPLTLGGITTTDSEGSIIGATFDVPDNPAGQYLVVVTDSTTLNHHSASFTITGITLSPSQGSVDTIVAVSGSGFKPSSTIIADFGGFGVISLAGPSTTDETGTIRPGVTFTVPTTWAGNHLVTITDESTTSSSTYFNVEPSVTLTPAKGRIGDTIQVSGFNFAQSSGITATWDGGVLPISGTQSTDSSGSFTGTTFIVPSTATSGTHTVAITDGSGNTGKATFITAYIALNPTDGEVSSSVIVSGAGFDGSTTVTVKFDDIIVLSPLTDPNGQFSGPFLVPPTTSGPHIVKATDGFNSAQASFTVSGITLTPANGPPGTSVTISGNGFAPNSALTATFEGYGPVSLLGSAVTDASGAVVAGVTFNVPPSPAGGYLLVVRDASSNSARATFTVKPTLSVKPKIGGYREIKVTGNGFLAGRTITIDFGGQQVPTTTPSVVVSDSYGAFTASFVLEQPSWQSWPDPGNTYIIHATDGTNTAQDSYQLERNNPTPTISLNPSQGSVGESVTVTGNNFDYNAPIMIIFDNVPKPTTPSPITTSSTGSFTASFIIPAATAGNHIVVASDGTYQAQATFNVKAQLIITASAGAGGSINPEGSVVVLQGNSQTFTITPDTNYYISELLVDSSQVTVTNRYTFPNVQTPHSIAASFQLDTTPPNIGAVTISPSSGTAGKSFTVNAIVTDAETGVNNVVAHIQHPDGSDVEIITLSGSGPYSGTWNSPTGAASGAYYVDIVATDNAGNIRTVNNAASLAITLTVTLRPNAAGTTTQLNAQGSGSANWDRVDEVTADEGTTYVRGTGDDARQTDTYNVPDQSLTGTITNVRIYIRSLENYDRNDVYAWTAIRIGTGSIQYGTQIGTTTSWTNYYTDYATKTGNLGSGAWTWADINNLQIGVGLQSHNSSGTWRYAECTQVWVVVEYIP